MPPRKKTKYQKAPAEPVPGPSATDVGPSRKRTIRGRRGGLKDMPNMPLDILIEIFGIMHPRDLLNLARTSKLFRAFLMNRSAQPLWKAAIENVEGLPKCPKYMSEPAYVNLVFFTHCHKCLKPNVQSVIFEFSARYCPSCRKTELVSLRHHPLADKIRSVIPEFGGLEVCFPAINASRNRQLHRPELIAFEEEWNGYVDTDEQRSMVADAEDRRELVMKAAEKYYEWKASQKAQRSTELDEIRSTRGEAIMNRLRQEGWGAEVDRMSVMDKYLFRRAFANKAEVLTNRAWQKIRECALAFMQAQRRIRLQEDREDLLRNRLEAFSKAVDKFRPGDRSWESDLGPNYLELALSEEFSSLLDAPDDADLTILDDAEAMHDKLQAAVSRWRGDCKANLQDRSLGSPDNIDRCALAVTFFECESCDRRDLRFPEILAHSCARQDSQYDYGLSLFQRTARRWLDGGSGTPWSSRDMFISADTASAMHSILEACGLDPEIATQEDAEGCGARLTCKAEFCASKQRPERDKDASATGASGSGSGDSYEVFDCYRALQHALKDEFKTHQWERVSDEDATKVAEVERRLSQSATEVEGCLLGCKHCSYATSKLYMLRHLKRRHDLEDDLNIGEHCYVHADTMPASTRLYIKHGEVEIVEAVQHKQPDFWELLRFGLEGFGFDFSDDEPSWFDENDSDDFMMFGDPYFADDADPYLGDDVDMIF